MPSDNPSQRNAGFSKELEILRTQSLSHPDKAAVSANVFDEFQVNPKMANYISRGGV